MGSKSKKRQREDPLASPEALSGYGETSPPPNAKKARLARHSTRGERDAVMSGAILEDDEPAGEKTEKKDKRSKKERKEAKRKAKQAEARAAAAGDAKEDREDGENKDGAVNGEGDHPATEKGLPQFDGADDAEDEKRTEKKEKKAKKEASEKDDRKKDKEGRKKDKKERKEKKAKARAEAEAAAAEGQDPAQASTSQKPDDADEIKFEDDDNAHGTGKKARFIAFVGNLPFTATKEDVEAHFSALAPFSVRLLHRKDNPTKSRGIAFVEFDRFDHMRTCLTKFHHSDFNDGKSDVRKINVELTAGGGGTSKNRKEKIQMKNAKLNEERIRNMQKEEAEKAEKEKNKAKAGGAPQQTQTQEEREEEQIHPSRRARVPHRQGGGRW